MGGKLWGGWMGGADDWRQIWGWMDGRVAGQRQTWGEWIEG